MNDEKKLDEKTLEEVTGGELMGSVTPEIPTGSCAYCVHNGPNCPHIDNKNFMLNMLSGKGTCYSFHPID